MERIRGAGQTAWAVVGIIAVLTLLGFVAWWLRVIFPPLILAGAIVYVLNPVVSRLERRGIPRVGGVALSYAAVIGGLVLVVLLVSPLIRAQADELADEWPEVRASIEKWIDDRAADSENWIISLPTVAEIEDQLGFNGDEKDLGSQLDTVREVGTRLFELALIFILGPIIAFYLLVDLPHLLKVGESLVPVAFHDEVAVVAGRLSRAIGGFFRGQLLVAFIVGVMVSAGLAVLQLPFWLLIGMIAGVFNIIPLIGPWVGAVPGVVVALTTADVGTAVWVAVIMAGAQQIDNHFISPLVMQRAVHLHPAAVMMALLAGGTLGGFFGLLIAVPTAAVLKILIGHLWRMYVLGQSLDDVREDWQREDAKPAVGIVEKIGDENPPVVPSEPSRD
ncbi:MAG TPA: AI-2E family transporter [Acidimicrobiales bacterium]